MPIGTCDPATRGDPYNVETLAQGPNGVVQITIRYGWDGVSVRPECDGPLVQPANPPSDRWAVKAVNGDTVSWYVHTVGKRGQPRTLELLPGQTRTATVAQAAALGYQSASDIWALSITREP